MLQINQYPVFKNNFLDWWAVQNGLSPDQKFPDFEPGSARTFIGDMSNDCKVAAVELIYPWFVKGNVQRSKAAQALVSASSPLRSSIGKNISHLSVTDPFSLILFCIRQDMWDDAISFLATRNNITVPVIEKHRDRLSQKFAA